MDDNPIIEAIEEGVKRKSSIPIGERRLKTWWDGEYSTPVEDILFEYHVGGNTWVNKRIYDLYMEEIKQECEDFINMRS